MPDIGRIREQSAAALRAGRHEEAVRLLRELVALDPGDWAGHTNLGVALRAVGRIAEAVAAHEAARRLKPDAPAVLNNLGNALLALDRMAEALEVFERVVALTPDSPLGHRHRGLTLIRLERFADALESLRTAVSLAPQDAQAHLLLGQALVALNRHREALAAYDRSIALDPRQATAHNDRGLAMISLAYAEGERAWEKAGLAALDTAVAMDPNNGDVRLARSLALLRLHRFSEGWADYEHRWRVDSFRRGSRGEARRGLQSRFEPGVSLDALRGRNVLLVAEQGVGDVVMFASIIPDLMATAGSVTLVCETRLHRLFAQAFPGLALRGPMEDDDTAPEFDKVLAMGSLGRLFRNRLEDFPGRPYLSASDEVRARWAARLGPKERPLRIGLSWRGGPPGESSIRRSMTLSTLRPLLERPDCEFVNLQYGDVRAELAAENATLPRPIWSPPPEDVADFEDLAGLVQNLDLVVSVQTAIVHLGGALGAPVWMMAPRQPEWRYGAEGERMPWYGSVRIFRQSPDGRWEPVVRQVADALTAQARNIARERGVAAIREGRYGDAVRLLREHVAKDPADWISHTNLGSALRSQGRSAEAVDAHEAARRLNPHSVAVLNNLGNALLDVHRVADALAVFERAVELEPDGALGHRHRGLALVRLKRHEEALESLQKALALEPDHAQTLFFMGNALSCLGRLREALAVYDRSIALDPRYALTHSNRGFILIDLAYAEGNRELEQEALAAFERAAALDPHHEDIRWSRSLALLRLHRFSEGWADYEHRWRVDSFRRGSRGEARRGLQSRFEPGVSLDALRGRNVLLVAEQGVGDVVMFASIIPDLMATAGSVTLVCETRLHRLFAQAFPGLALRGPMEDDDTAPEFDKVLAMGSLGRLFRNRLEDFPGRPYLSASDEVRARWAARLGPKERPLRIGLSWRGGPPGESSIRRSMTLSTLRPLLERPDCEFVNLQYGDVRAELAAENATLPRPIWSPPPEDVADFEDLAGLVQNLDLVVSVQTAIVHLGGALGAPVWMMAPRQPEWRYGAEGERMPWYGSVRIFRQSPDGRWEPVVRQVADALTDIAPGGSPADRRR
ncbi:tetratricopeptide repeat protein [Phenylobacterium sp.]|uniref:tetratricopeptide repeat protein n=1 Tax=Phenylobacterium sp. TaxID=1871053 RepID=UPI00391D0909